MGAVLTLRAGVMLTGSIVFGLAAALVEVLVFPVRMATRRSSSTQRRRSLSSYASRPSRPRIACLAGLIAVAALIRHDHGLYIGVAALASVALSPPPSDRFKGALSVAMLAARWSFSCCRI